MPILLIVTSVRVSPFSAHTTKMHRNPLYMALSMPPRKPFIHGATTPKSPH